MLMGTVVPGQELLLVSIMGEIMTGLIGLS